MSKKKDKATEKAGGSGDGLSEHQGTASEGSHKPKSSKPKKLEHKHEEAAEMSEGQKKRKQKKQEKQKQQQQKDPGSSQQPQQPQPTQQPQEAWGRGPGPSQQPQQPQPTQQPQEAWGSGPGPSQLPQQPQPMQHPQGAWGRGPGPSRQPQPMQQPQGAWGSGPGPSQLPQQPQPTQQPQGAWGRGAGPFQQPQQPQPMQQPQGAWGRGPGPFQQPQQPQPMQQPQGAWGRGAGPFQQPQQPQPMQQPQGAWGRGAGPFQQPQPTQQPQGAWGRGPGPFQQPQQPQPMQQPQGAWGRGPGPSQQPQPTQQPEGAWGRGPGPSQQPQPTQQPEGAWGRGPDFASGDRKVTAESPVHKKPPRIDKVKGSEEKRKLSEPVEHLEFAPRITAAKKSGRPISVFTNFFPLLIMDPNTVAYHYDVIIEPDKPKYLMRTVWNKYVSMMFPGRLTAFDGKNAYSRGPLTNGGSTSATVTVLNTESNREKEFNVSIEEVRRISWSCFDNYREKMIQSRSMKSLPEAEIAVLDIILKNRACDNFVRSSRHFFPFSSARPLTYELSEKLSLRVGYFQSAFLGYKPYLNFDIAHKAFYVDLPVLNVAANFKNRRTGDIEIDEMNHFMRSVKVEYTPPPNDPASRKIFTVNKLVNNAKSQFFAKEDGTQISVAKYFETEKNFKLRYPELPLLWVGPTQKSIYLPMELCRIAPDQIYRGMMDPFETRKMVQNATSNARERKRDALSLLKNCNINSDPLMREFGLQVTTEMEKVAARVLDPPRLKTSRNVKVEDGVWRIQDFLEPVRLRKWCILNLDDRINKQSLMNFQHMLKSKGIEYRMEISDPSREPMNEKPVFASMKKAFSQLKGMEMVFVVISEAKGVYSRVKAICETQEGVLTQCVKSRTLSQDPRKLTTTVQNILLKVNAKLGGKNHCLDGSSVPKCLNGYVMIVGADVTHPSPGMKIPSVAAVTVSCDPAAFQYGTTTRVQPKGEMIKDLEEIMSIHLKKFYKIRNKYPEKIIFFRDGVSEGELPKVFTNELSALKRACNGYCQPKITFVVVQKRHHTKFFPTCAADEQGKNFNVPVGTCVDSDIVHPRDLDFYLVSHASILGTARPTRYRLLHDDNVLTDEELETLSFYLCHLFSRCNRSVSYPSPTYNAHLAAARVRAHLEGLNLMGGEDIDYIKNKMPDHISVISPMYFV